ncbi:MAG: hypothetical protein MUF15_23550 [Acidobacteria bacterium]|nr:hypothetical protein [Acidobacteriota bacterium]
MLGNPHNTCNNTFFQVLIGVFKAPAQEITHKIKNFIIITVIYLNAARKWRIWTPGYTNGKT